MNHIRLLSLLVLLLTGTAHAQAPGASSRASGQPFLTSYSPADYGAAATTWSVTQDARGVIYVANGSGGLLTYDGATWRRLPLANRLTLSLIHI